MTDDVEIRFDCATRDAIESHLRACDGQFVPPLSTRVDVDHYVDKLRARAITVEAWDGDILVGLVAAYIDAAAASCFVSSVSTLPGFTGRGIASRLLRELAACAGGKGAREVLLEVSKGAAGARRLYGRQGFAPVGDRGERLLLRRNLDDAPGSTGATAEGAAMRNHDREYQDDQESRYAYDFDAIIRRYLLRTLEPHFVRAGTVLELGCFRGDMTAQILEYFPELTALEAARVPAEETRARFPGRVTVVTTTFEQAKPGRRFDNVFLVHTLEHLDDPVGMLVRFREWLAPDGRLFVAVPNANALSRQIAVRMGLIDHNAAVTPAESKHGHRWTYSLDVLLSHLRRAGYDVRDHGGVIVKPLANYQFDQAMAAGIVGEAYVEACHALAKVYPDLSASIYAVCALPR